ncbi:MAG: low temperature requirement protein A [Longimicrobiales bacterium]
MLLDVIAAAVGGQLEGWNLHAAHFVERHALFVIIALGETLIVAAAGLAGASWNGQLVAVAVLAVAITCALWWTYFARARSQLEHALESARGSVQSMMARDAFSLLHFPMLCGIIAYAAAVEEALAHPDQPLPLEARIALALGLALFVGGMALAMWRATRRLLLPRVAIITATAIAVVALAGILAAFTLGLAFLGAAAIAALEQRSEAQVVTAVRSS